MGENMIKKFTLLTLILSIWALPSSTLYAHGGGADSSSSTSSEVSTKIPNVFAVLQQQGPVCPYLPFYNLNIVKDLRQKGEGDIDFSQAEFFSKLKGYAKFLPHIRVLDDAYDNLRGANGPYKRYEDDIRNNGIKNTERFKGGKLITEVDWKPTDKARRDNYTPYNIATDQGLNYCDRLLPIFHKNGKVYFYNHETNQAQEMTTNISAGGKPLWLYTYNNEKQDDFSSSPKLYMITSEMERLMGGALDQNRISVGKNRFGATTVYFYSCSKTPLYRTDIFYDIGTYQHMLFAMGLDRNNNKFTSTSPEWAAYQEFKAEMDKNPLNPWYKINAEDLFEYQLAELFKADASLKTRAIKSVEYYNSPWKYYQESMGYTDKGGNKFSTKTKYIPGDDQMLAYYFTSQLRFLWAATEGMDAIIEIEELQEELGEKFTAGLKMMSWFPGVPSPANIIKTAVNKQYSDSDGKFSFVDAWVQIKKGLQQKLGNKLDFVTFTGHGCIISIDDDLVETQPHEFKDVARILGIEMWEQHYDKGFTGLHYQKKGNAADVIKFG